MDRVFRDIRLKGVISAKRARDLLFKIESGIIPAIQRIRGVYIEISRDDMYDINICAAYKDSWEMEELR